MDIEGFGLSNFELEHFFKGNGQNLSDNFIGVFPADEKKYFLDKISSQKIKYLFMIANTNPKRKPVVYWWLFWDMDERDTLFFFFLFFLFIYFFIPLDHTSP